MNFIQPAFLAALGALSIPLAIHLLRSRRLKNLDLGTLRFVREALSETTRWRRLREWLLLFLRLAVVALAVLLFARPFQDRTPPPPDREAGAEWICVLDVSPSMRFQEPGKNVNGPPPNAALELFQERLAAAPEGVRTVPLLFADSVREIASPEEAEHAIGGSCDYAALARWLAERVARDSSASRRVVLFTDLQQPEGGIPDDLKWPDGAPVEIVSVVPPSATNLSLEPPARRVQPFVAGKETLLRLPVARGGDAPPGKFTARAGPGREIANIPPVEYAADLEEIELKLKPDKPGDVEAIAGIQAGDPWPLDDQCDLTVRFTDRLPVLLVDGDRGEESAGSSFSASGPAGSPFAAETYFLRQALLTPERGQSTGIYDITVTDHPVEEAPDRPWRVIALCNVESVSEAGIRFLTQRVKAGAGLLLFPGEKTDAAAWRRLTEAGLCPAQVKWRTGPAVPRALAAWDAKHPALAPFSAREQGDLSRLILLDRFQITPSPGATVAASMDGRRGALITGSLEKGRTVLFANPVDRAWTDLPNERLFLPFVHALCQYAAGAGAAAEEGLPEVRDLSLAEGAFPGRQGNAILRVPPGESGAPFLDETALRALLRLGEPPAPVSTPANEAWRTVAGAARPDEWWPWFALALLLLLITETFLADFKRPVSAPITS